MNRIIAIMPPSMKCMILLLLLSCLPDSHGFISQTTRNQKSHQHQTSEPFQRFLLYKNDESSSSSDHIINRRDVFSSSLAHLLAPVILASSAPRPADAAVIRISQYPSLEYLEPLYELKLSVDALKQAMIDPSKTKRPFIQKRLEKMFSGGLFSEKNVYIGLAVAYNNQIKYSESELSTYIKLDKEERLGYIDSAFKSLESLKNNLKKGDGIVHEEDLIGDADNAQRLITAWFSKLPNEEIEAVDKLFKMSREADINRDGKLDASELATLPEKEQNIWLKRVVLIGD